MSGTEDKAKDEDKVAQTITVTDNAARELERELRRHPEDPDTKVDVGSEESMDASDPTAASQPGQTGEPAPSSGFPEKESQK